MSALTVDRREQDGAVVLLITGSLVGQDASPLEDALRAAFRQRTRQLVLDLAAVPYVDTSGIAILVTALKQAQSAGTVLRLVAIGTQPRQVLGLTHLDRVFDIRESVEAALQT